MLRYLFSTLLVVVTVACVTPHQDPHDFPCGDPRDHWCPRTVAGAPLTCCWDGWDCGGSPEFPGCRPGECCDAIGLDQARRGAAAGWAVRPQIPETRR